MPRFYLDLDIIGSQETCGGCEAQEAGACRLFHENLEESSDADDIREAHGANWDDGCCYERLDLCKSILSEVEE